MTASAYVSSRSCSSALSMVSFAPVISSRNDSGRSLSKRLSEVSAVRCAKSASSESVHAGSLCVRLASYRKSSASVFSSTALPKNADSSAGVKVLSDKTASAMYFVCMSEAAEPSSNIGA